MRITKALKQIKLFKSYFSEWNMIGRFLALIRVDEDQERRIQNIEQYLHEEGYNNNNTERNTKKYEYKEKE